MKVFQTKSYIEIKVSCGQYFGSSDIKIDYSTHEGRSGFFHFRYCTISRRNEVLKNITRDQAVKMVDNHLYDLQQIKKKGN